MTLFLIWFFFDCDAIFLCILAKVYFSFLQAFQSWFSSIWHHLLCPALDFSSLLLTRKSIFEFSAKEGSETEERDIAIWWQSFWECLIKMSTDAENDTTREIFFLFRSQKNVWGLFRSFFVEFDGRIKSYAFKKGGQMMIWDLWSFKKFLCFIHTSQKSKIVVEIVLQ